ncbi:hypothetical protein EDD85DRAFT_977822, partial [Armillaria nabsnona]
PLFRARSGFSFLSTPDGIVLHGSYCKEHVNGKRPIGIVLEDTWFLKMSLEMPAQSKSTADPLKLKWEHQKQPSTAFTPSLCLGCAMAVWAARSTRVLFGEVKDKDTSEETLESIFWNSSEDETAAFDEEPNKIAMLKKIEEVPETDAEKDALHAQVMTFMGVTQDSTRSTKDVISTPLPGETLAMFYSRSHMPLPLREYWAQKAHAMSDN